MHAGFDFVKRPFLLLLSAHVAGAPAALLETNSRLHLIFSTRHLLKTKTGLVLFTQCYAMILFENQGVQGYQIMAFKSITQKVYLEGLL